METKFKLKFDLLILKHYETNVFLKKNNGRYFLN